MEKSQDKCISPDEMLSIIALRILRGITSKVSVYTLYAEDANLRPAVYTTVQVAPSKVGDSFGSETSTVVFTGPYTLHFIIELVEYMVLNGIGQNSV